MTEQWKRCDRRLAQRLWGVWSPIDGLWRSARRLLLCCKLDSAAYALARGQRRDPTFLGVRLPKRACGSARTSSLAIRDNAGTDVRAYHCCVDVDIICEDCCAPVHAPAAPKRLGIGRRCRRVLARRLCARVERRLTRDSVLAGALRCFVQHAKFPEFFPARIRWEMDCSWRPARVPNVHVMSEGCDGLAFSLFS